MIKQIKNLGKECSLASALNLYIRQGKSSLNIRCALRSQQKPQVYLGND